ncbi:MAG: phosphate-starvation-inducible PsiE family protein [Calothrix sp. C42_A2020_038]|nr:phosphate-starvation-inducible PsiE family protein [Calothrix sp. C42_A2020_038]
MTILLKLSKQVSFLNLVVDIKRLFTKILSITMVIVIIVAVIHLVVFLISDLISRPFGHFSLTLLNLLGIFLNILIALEILRNITAYLHQKNSQLKLVLTTSLIAITRKFIIYDLEKLSGLNLIGLSIIVLALSASYRIIRHINAKI